MTRKLNVRIRKLLKTMSVEHLADRMNVSVSTIWRWRSGNTRRPMLSLLARLDEIDGQQAKVRPRARSTKTPVTVGDLWILVLNVAHGAKGTREQATKMMAQKARELSPKSYHHQETDIVQRWALARRGK